MEALCCNRAVLLLVSELDPLSDAAPVCLLLLPVHVLCGEYCEGLCCDMYTKKVHTLCCSVGTCGWQW